MRRHPTSREHQLELPGGFTFAWLNVAQQKCNDENLYVQNVEADES